MRPLKRPIVVALCAPECPAREAATKTSQPSQSPHEYGPGIRPKDATDKEARTPRSRGRSVVVLYNELRTHLSLNKDAPVTRQIQRIGSIKSHAILGGLHHHYARA